MKTLLEVLQATSAYFGKRGIESPRLNAEHLIAHTLKKRRIDLYLEFDRPLSESELEPMRELVRQRGDGVPLQHLLGTVEFYGRTFRCDARALVPRPETEELVEQILKHGKPSRILDVGTGSGVIALTLAAELPGATVHGIDISGDALKLAQENAMLLGLTDRVRFWESDLLSAVDGTYDLVAANLPYIAADAVPTLSREVQQDPHVALNGGAAGHEIIEKLISSAPQHLAPGGLLALETGGENQPQLLTGALEKAGFTNIRCTADLQGVTRFVFADR